MRRRIGSCLLAVLMLAALMVPAFAAGGTIDIVKTEPGNWTVVVDKDNAEKLIVTVKDGSTGDFELIMVQDSTGAPTAEGLFYIDQQTKASGDVVFTVYPNTDKMNSDDTYYVFLSSTAVARTQVASFKYQTSDVPAGKVGDVNGKDGITIDDVTAILRHLVEKELLDEAALLRANVFIGKDEPAGTVDMSDVTTLLQVLVEKVKEEDLPIVK